MPIYKNEGTLKTVSTPQQVGVQHVLRRVMGTCPTFLFRYWLQALTRTELGTEAISDDDFDFSPLPRAPEPESRLARPLFGRQTARPPGRRTRPD